jgi:hypothetical protein
MYKAARDKLHLIARQLDPEQFELLFSRVMTLVPPKELEELLGAVNRDHVFDGIGELVSEGFEAWKAFDDAYRANADRIQVQSSGQATWDDLGHFLIRYCGAELGPTTNRTTFTFEDDEIVSVEGYLPTLTFGDELYALGELGGVGSVGTASVQQLGLNLGSVAQSLRRAFFSERSVGAGYISRPPSLPSEMPSETFGMLLFLRQSLRFAGDRPAEEGLTFHAFTLVSSTAGPKELDRKTAAETLRKLSQATRIREPQRTGVEFELIEAEARLLNDLRRPTETEVTERIRHVVWPVAAIIVVADRP